MQVSLWLVVAPSADLRSLTMDRSLRSDVIGGKSAWLQDDSFENIKEALDFDNNFKKPNDKHC